MPPSPRRALFVLAGCLALSACLVYVREVEVESIAPRATGTRVESPVKAHLLDGSTVVYTDGVTVGSDSLYGTGARYDLRLNPRGVVNRLPLDSVVGMENFRTGINAPASAMLTVGATVLGTLGTGALMVAIFGSCPTIYADSAGTLVLEAESFSYSIAPLFETRDVDRLGVRPQPDGEVWLEIRNEALETHYLNHLELLAVRHDPRETVMPDAGARPLALASQRAPVSAVDRSGRDVVAALARADAEVYASAPALLAGARVDDMRDHVDLVFPAPPPGTDSVAVVLRLRNSLLTTILLYDVMLGSGGARSLDWLGSEIEQVGSALELGQWYNRHMGLRILLWDDGEFRQVGRIPDTGPIAWKDVAAMIPVPAGGDSLRVRLGFVTDSWRIDRVALAMEARRPEVRTIPAARVTGADGQPDPGVLRHIQAPDEQYLETRPGQRFTLHFDTGVRPDDGTHTFLLASQGYYTEWIRQGWIRSAQDDQMFRPSDAMLFTALERWRSRRDSFEEDFYNTRIPVR
jgi:hypothetical protein